MAFRTGAQFHTVPQINIHTGAVTSGVCVLCVCVERKVIRVIRVIRIYQVNTQVSRRTCLTRGNVVAMKRKTSVTVRSGWRN